MVLKFSKSIGLCLFFFLVLGLAPVSVWPQEYGTEGQAAQAEVSDKEIAAFAKAQNMVTKIRRDYQSGLSDLEDQAERQKIVQEMNEKLVAAVKSEGLSVERYNEIFNASQNDSGLQQRISEAMQSIQ